jgi:hypothetical protein
MAKSRFQQAMLIGIGIMVAIGFSGIFSYSGLVNTGDSNNQDREEINATLPSNTYTTESFGLSVQEQAYLAVNEQKVFVNAIYDDNASAFEGLESLSTEFGNRTYTNMINTSETAFATGYNLSKPSVLVIGDQPGVMRGRRIPYSIRNTEPDRESIKSGICSAMRDPGNLAAKCFS